MYVRNYSYNLLGLLYLLYLLTYTFINTIDYTIRIITLNIFPYWEFYDIVKFQSKPLYTYNAYS